MARIDYWHTQMPGIGARKLVRQLKNEGFAVGRKLVRRLMGEKDRRKFCVIDKT